MKKKNPYATVSCNTITVKKKSTDKEPRATRITSEIDLRARASKK